MQDWCGTVLPLGSVVDSVDELDGNAVSKKKAALMAALIF